MKNEKSKIIELLKKLDEVIEKHDDPNIRRHAIGLRKNLMKKYEIRDRNTYEYYE